MKVPNLLDTVPEVLGVYLAVLSLGCVTVGAQEHWTFGDSLWWAVVTATTTGYGDLAPHTPWGRAIAAGVMLLCWLFNLLLGGLVAAKLIVNSDAWTHQEQEEVKTLLRQIAEREAGDGR